MSHPHVFFIQPSLNAVGGIEKVVPTVARGLSERGYTVSAHTFYDRPPQEQTFWHSVSGEDEQQTVSIWNKLVKIFRRCRSISAHIRMQQPDCVIASAQGAICIVILLKLIRVIDVPVIAYIHEARGDGGPWYRVLTWFLYPWADGWLCVSDGIRREISALPRVQKDRVVLAYNALPDARRSQQDGSRIASFMEDLPRPLFITAGRLEYAKGADVLVRSFIDYADTNSGTLVVLGTGSLLSMLQKETIEARKSDRIHFVGVVSSVTEHMSLCDGYLSCARSEPFGLALIEALSVGIPIMATDVPSGPREILSPTRVPDKYPFRSPFGILMHPPQEKRANNSTEFAKALSLLLANVYEPKQLRRRAEDFSPSVQLDAVQLAIKMVS